MSMDDEEGPRFLSETDATYRQLLVKRDNSVTLQFVDEKDPEKEVEITQLQFLQAVREKKLKYETIVEAQQTSANELVVKFTNHVAKAELQTALRKINLISGTLLKIRDTEDTSSKPKYPVMHIYNCPHEIENFELRQLLSNYCEPIRVWSGRFKTPPFTNILNGVRHMSFKFSIDHGHIPKFLFIKTHRIKISYDGQPRHQVECYHCREMGHISKNCVNEPKCGIAGCDDTNPHTRQECSFHRKQEFEYQRKRERDLQVERERERQDDHDIEGEGETHTEQAEPNMQVEGDRQAELVRQTDVSDMEAQESNKTDAASENIEQTQDCNRTQTELEIKKSMNQMIWSRAVCQKIV